MNSLVEILRDDCKQSMAYTGIVHEMYAPSVYCTNLPIEPHTKLNRALVAT